MNTSNLKREVCYQEGELLLTPPPNPTPSSHPLKIKIVHVHNYIRHRGSNFIFGFVSLEVSPHLLTQTVCSLCTVCSSLNIHSKMTPGKQPNSHTEIKHCQQKPHLVYRKNACLEHTMRKM